MLPFAFLLLLVFVYEHYVGILTFCWLTFVLCQVNDLIKRQVALREERQDSLILLIISVLLSHVVVTFLLFRHQRLWRHLLFLPPDQPLSFWSAIWVAVITDVMARYVTAIIKCSVLILCSQNGQHRRRAQLFSIIEVASSVLRSLLTIPIWYTYLVDEAFGHIFSSLVTGIYLAMKLTLFLDRFRVFVSALHSFLLKEVQYGRQATAEQIMEYGEGCAICQEKMERSIVLLCRHIFCEGCVSEWFERERTCPLCRSVVVQASNTRDFTDGSTTLLVQFF